MDDRRGEPEHSALDAVLASHLETFLAQARTAFRVGDAMSEVGFFETIRGEIRTIARMRMSGRWLLLISRPPCEGQVLVNPKESAETVSRSLERGAGEGNALAAKIAKHP